jgi:hypothetical protein
VKPLSVISVYVPAPWFETSLKSLASSNFVEKVVVVSPVKVDLDIPKRRFVSGRSFQSRNVVSRIVNEADTRYLLVLTGTGGVAIEPGALERLVGEAESRGAGIVYSDFYEEGTGGRTPHPLNDYELGSVRDDFEFGGVMLLSTEAVKKSLDKYGDISDADYSYLYDLRLKVSIDHTLYRVPEPLHTVISSKEGAGDEKLFAYVDPRNASVQKEMEAVFTDHLKRIGAYRSPGQLQEAEQSMDTFPVEASVVIPVRNRRRTIADAVKSALSQEADFPFNVLVVDNHSTDGTTDILSGLAAKHGMLGHIIPVRTDLGIGGCWNEAINSVFCGRYAVQLDSDDLYSSPKALQSIIDMFHHGKYAMVIGSYTIVDSNLRQVPPGLIDHREWTDENGHNNALRINGLGAPRAFDTRVIRRTGFPNVSYGEDYAAALRICREYRVGRIFESLYLARRWEGNTDAGLTIEATNRNDASKDRIRTEEILARQKLNART